MTKDEIIAMARQSGFDTYKNETAGVEGYDCTEELERFAALVAAKEREACAQIADVHALGWQENPGANPEAGFIATSNCATAIRARSKP